MLRFKHGCRDLQDRIPQPYSFLEKDTRLRECEYGDKIQPKKNWDLKDFIDRSYPGSESYRDVKPEYEKFVEDVKKTNPNGYIAVLSHQAPQLALEVIVREIAWREAIENDWRNVRGWKAGRNHIIT